MVHRLLAAAINADRTYPDLLDKVHVELLLRAKGKQETDKDGMKEEKAEEKREKKDGMKERRQTRDKTIVQKREEEEEKAEAYFIVVVLLFCCFVSFRTRLIVCVTT